MTFILTTLSIFILLFGFVHVDNTFAETQDELKERVTNAAMQDANVKCANSQYNEIQMRQIASEQFNKSPDLPGNMFPHYQSTFVSGCTTMQEYGIQPTAGGPVFDENTNCFDISDIDQKQVCFSHQALASNNWQKCLGAPDEKLCIVGIATETKNPSIILDITKPPGPNQIAIYNQNDRDDMLGLYVPMTGDFSVLDKIKDNRKHDGVVILSMGSIYGRTGMPPNSDYCANLRGDYQYDYLFNDGVTLGEEKNDNHNLCEGVSAALRDVTFGTNECDDSLPGKIISEYGYEVEDNVELCNQFKKDLPKELEKINKLFPDDDMEFGGDGVTKEEIDSLKGNFIVGGKTTPKIDPYKEGFDQGSANFECKDAGRNDYLEDKGKTEPEFFIIEGALAVSNPYLPLLDQEKWEQFRDGYTKGCKSSYSDGYEQERRKASSSGSSFFDDDLGGCLIATAAYGTELAPEVQNLREIRNKMYTTQAGGGVMHAVNDFYYSFSPTVADWEREYPAFREAVKILITPSMASFTILDHNSIDTEEGLIGYVIGAVFLNVGMYFVAPAVVVWQVRKRI